MEMPPDRREARHGDEPAVYFGRHGAVSPYVVVLTPL